MQIAHKELAALRKAQLAENVSRFLAIRGLNPSALMESAARIYPDSLNRLFTSSPVQGLATPTSDIDIIAVLPSPVSNREMATQFYVDGYHCEVVGLGIQEVTRACERLEEIARYDIDEIFDELARWNSAYTVSTKYLERLINGIDANGEQPFSGSIPALSRVWSARALKRFLYAAISLELSRAAQERRAPVAYGLSLVAEAMDIILCIRGFIYSNKKWILSRWRDNGQAALTETGLEPLYAELTTMHLRLRRSLGNSITEDEHASLRDLIKPILGFVFNDNTSTWWNRISIRANFEETKRIQDTVVGVADRSFSFLHGSNVYQEKVFLASIATLDTLGARRLLNIVRSGLTKIAVD